MPERHLIKKYANRKLYDTNTRRYVTLDRIAELVREGHEVRVVERDTGRDLTAVTLSQVLLVEGKEEERRGSLPEAVLTDLIQTRGGAVLDYLRRSLSVPTDIVSQAGGQFEARVDAGVQRAFESLNLATHVEVRRLLRRIERIEKHLGLEDERRDRSRRTRR
jgi:polyhydroxyalkanoate synthesis repressor PhaR